MTGWFVGKEIEKVGIEIPFGPFPADEIQRVILGKIIEDLSNIALGFFVDMGILNVNDDSFAGALEALFDLSD